MTIAILFGTFVIALIIGIPVSVSLGISAVVSFIYCDIPLVMISQKLFTGIDSASLMAIPLFILAGNIMTDGGISGKIVEFVNCLTGRIRGSLGYTAVLACAIFAALSGSGPATVIAIGSMLYPAMKQMGYPEKTSAGLLAVAGGLGPVIPPSIIMIVYGTLTGVSITDMFAVGLFWGVVTTVVFCLIVAVMANWQKWPKAGVQHQRFKGFLQVLLDSFPALLIPFIILGGIYSGIFTPTESAGIAVVAAIFIGIFVYREIKWTDLPRIFVTSAKGSATVMFIIACASSFSYFFSYTGLSKGISDFVVNSNMSKTVFLLFCFILFLIFGMFMDGTSIAVLLVPLLWPIVQAMGIDGIHFGIMFCIMNSLGCCTPPVAVNIFGIANISKLNVEDVSKGEMPFFIANLAIVIFIILVPQITAFVVP